MSPEIKMYINGLWGGFMLGVILTGFAFYLIYNEGKFMKVMYKRFFSTILRTGIQRRLKRGIRISILPSYACNFNCDYCGRIVDGVYPNAKLKDLESWKQYLTDLNKTLKKDRSKIKEIILTGGEPTILPYFVELSNWILDQGWMLQIYTNLSKPERLIEVKQSHRLIIHASFHATEITSVEFNKNWEIVDEYHRTTVDEIGERKLINPYKNTRLKPLVPLGTKIMNLATLRVDPNFAAYLYCYEESKANTKVTK